MVEWMICPICGKKFDAAKYEYLDNGNPACPRCVAEEQCDNEDKE